MAANEYRYQYSASNQRDVTKEVEKIRNQYAGKQGDVDALEQLRKLDAKAKKPALAASLAVGISGTLILGFGMSLAMAMNHFSPGIIVGVL